MDRPATADHDTPSAEPTDVVERSVDLDLDLDAAVDAVLRPEVLSEWIGEWTETDEGASVRTDDGVTRRVDRIRPRTDGVSWRWWPERDGAPTDVEITVVPLDGGRSRLTVREVVAVDGARPAPATLDGLAWAVRLLALEVAAALRAAALVSA